MLTVLGKSGLAAFAMRYGFALGSRTVITTTGGSTYTPPAGCQLILVECIAGGGAGQAAAAASAAQLTCGVGGNSGGYAASLLWAATSRLGYLAAVGLGGTSVTNGGATTFSTKDLSNLILISVPGGSSGSGFTAMTTGVTETFLKAGAPTTGTGQVIRAGATGGVAHRVSGAVGSSGMGAPGPWGGGANPVIAQGPGNAGIGFGASGSGGLSVNAGGATAGGVGAPGVIVVWEFY